MSATTSNTPNNEIIDIQQAINNISDLSSYTQITKTKIKYKKLLYSPIFK